MVSFRFFSYGDRKPFLPDRRLKGSKFKPPTKADPVAKISPPFKLYPGDMLCPSADCAKAIKENEVPAVRYVSVIVQARVNTHLELKRKTEQLRQKDLQLIEMDRIAGGTLAAGIAHEIISC